MYIKRNKECYCNAIINSLRSCNISAAKLEDLIIFNIRKVCFISTTPNVKIKQSVLYFERTIFIKQKYFHTNTGMDILQNYYYYSV